MRLIIDENLPPRLAAWLRDQGVEAAHVHEMSLGRTPDPQVREAARRTGAIIVSKDEDFVRMQRPADGPLLFLTCGNLPRAELLRRFAAAGPTFGSGWRAASGWLRRTCGLGAMMQPTDKHVFRFRGLHLTGASGAGVSTLGRALAGELDAAWFDTDDFYWTWDVEPYTVKRSVADRLELLRRVLDGASRWVLSGSLDGWGDPLIGSFRAVIYVSTPTATRVERLRRREVERFGEAVQPSGSRRQAHLDFLAWAEQYDDGNDGGRNRSRHEAWLASLPCPVLRLNGERPVNALVDDALAWFSDLA